MPGARGPPGAHPGALEGCPWRSSGRGLWSVGGHVVGRLADREDLHRLVVWDADSVAVLELHCELHEVQRVGAQVLLEARVLLDPARVDFQLLGEVRTDALEYLSPIHRTLRR